MFIRTEAYGSHGSQCGDLYLPDDNPRSVVCLLHGGFWRMPYGREQLDPLARALCSDGFAVWNLEYRRIGGDGGWPNTFLDVAAGIDHLSNTNLPLSSLIVVGHSAGGHLAFWFAKRRDFPGIKLSGIRPRLVVGLAPLVDLAGGDTLDLGNGAIRELIGPESDNQRADRLGLVSPYERVPLGVQQIIIHGEQDNFVPVALSERYVEAAHAAGDDIKLVRLAEAGHMEFLDPESEASQLLRRSLD